ncbi:MAG TPA: IclR family transcriptional regulator C-terminal domain-containing protein [Micromonosporaceae bacterium]|jgi:DNA-binding IclR family transcriptional regulator
MGSAPSDLIQSVSRALRVLEQVTQASRSLPVKVIARRCGLNLSTAYHLTRTLCYEGYLARQPDGTYGPGPKVAERFHELVGSLHRPPAASAVLGHLSAACGHTAYLARFATDRMIIVQAVEGPRSPWLEDLQVGLDAAAHATALGKSLLATLPRRTVRRVLAAQGMRPFTRRTPTDVATIEGELRGVRPGDVVIERGEFRDDVACASIVTPAVDSTGWWAMGVSARGLDLPDPLIAHLRRASADLGARPGQDAQTG